MSTREVPRAKLFATHLRSHLLLVCLVMRFARDTLKLRLNDHRVAGLLRVARLNMWMFLVGLALRPELAEGQPVPSYEGAVNDQAQMLPYASRLYLKHILTEYEAHTGHQLAFLSVDSLDGFAPEVFALKVVESWKLGRAQADDGLLLLVAKQDRRVRIEVGYGLEGAVPDAIANRVIDEVLTPALRREQYAWGVLNAIKTLMHNADEHSAKVMSDPVAALLEVEAPAVGSFMNDRAQLFDGSQSQRLSAKLGKVAAEYGMTFAVLTMRCPERLQLERCVDAVNELWSGPLAHYDGLVTLFVYAPAGSEATGESGHVARLTLDRMATPPKQAWRKGVDPSNEVEVALGELAERAGVVWSVHEPPPPASPISPPMAARRSDFPLSYQEKVVWSLVVSVLVGMLGLAYVIHRHHVRNAPPEEQESFLSFLLRFFLGMFLGGGDSKESSSTPYHGRGGRSWGSGGDAAGTGDDGRKAGGGSFGGGGASGSW